MNRFMVLAWLSGIALLSVVPGNGAAQGVPGRNGAETPPAGDLKPRSAVQMGIDSYFKGEYEVADVYLRQAEQVRTTLSPSEQARLAEYTKKNNEALNGRRAALAQMTEADKLIREGKAKEAEAMLKALKANKFLTANDQQVVTAMSTQLKGNTPAQGVPAYNPPVKGDPATLLAEARKACDRGDYDQAESLARAAEQAGYSTINPFADRPAKVIKDAQAGRAKMAKATTPGKSTPTTKVGRAGDQKTAQARSLLQQAHQAVQAGDLVRARQLVKEAEALNVKLDWWDEYTPAKLNAEIARAEAGQIKNGVTTASNTQPVKSNPTSATDPKVMLKQARQALERDDLETAETMAKQARMAHANWGLFEDTPDKVLADVVKARDAVNGKRATEMLAEARRKLDQGQLDEAEKLTYQAEALRKTYPVWYRGERPDKLRAEIATKRKQGSRPNLPPLLDPMAQKAPVVAKSEPVKQASATMPLPPSMPPAPPAAPVAPVDPRQLQAKQMLAQARVHLNRGEHKTALDLALQVKAMNVPVDSDSPEAILQAVTAVQATAQARVQPQQAEIARQQALQLVAEARAHQKAGRLIEALQTVRQAHQVNAVFLPGDELPEAVVADLQRDCQAQLKTYTDAAKTLADRRMYKEAEEYLKYTQELALTFRVDVAPINKQLAAVKGMAATIVPPTDAVAGATVNEGTKLLAEAEKALQAEQLEDARNLANSLYTGNFGMKAQAAKLLAQIDNAEHHRQVKKVKTAFDQFKRSVARKEYDAAVSFAQLVDVKLLDNDADKTFFQEMMSSKELQPKSIVQASAKEVDPPSPGMPVPVVPVDPAKDSLLKEVQARQAVEFQRLKELKRQCEVKANQLATKGDLDGAMAELEKAMTAVKESTLDTEALVPMQKQLAKRKQDYSTMKAQADFSKLQKDQLAQRNEAAMRKLKAKEHQKEEVAKLLEQYKTYMKEGKYEQAEVVALKAHEMDPDNVAADAGAFKAKMMRNVTNEERLAAIKENGNVMALNDLTRAAAVTVDDRNPISHDNRELWLKSRNRKAVTGPNYPIPAMEKDVSQKLNSMMSIDFKNKPLSEAIDELRIQSGANFAIEEQFVKEEGVDLNQPVTIQLSNVKLSTALDLMLANARLTHKTKDGVIVVTTPTGKKGDRVVKTYSVADLIIPRDDMGSLSDGSTLGGNKPGSPNLAWQKYHYNGQPIRTSGTGSMLGTGEEGANVLGSSGATTAKEPRQLGQTMEKMLMNLITHTIAPESWDTVSGSGHIEFFPYGSNLVVTQTPDIQEQVQALLDKLRELQEVQITVEVRFITVQEDFFERVGIDFDLNINDKQTKFDNQVATQNFKPPGFLNEPDHLKNVVVGLTPTGNFTQSLDIPITNGSFQASALPSGFAGFPGSVGSNGGLDMGVAFLSSIEVFLFLEAVQGNTRANVMTAPKLTLFNGQTAAVTVSTNEFFVTQFQAQRDFFTGAIVFIPIPQQFTTGTFLAVQAVVTADRRYVQLTLNPSISRIAEVRVFSAIAGLQQQLPVVESTSISTTVQVPDGGTILMGGLKTMTERRLEFGPPVLSKLPYINRLFRNQSYGREGNSLLIMVTPRIIIPEEEEERLGQTFAF